MPLAGRHPRPRAAATRARVPRREALHIAICTSPRRPRCASAEGTWAGRLCARLTPSPSPTAPGAGRPTHTHRALRPASRLAPRTNTPARAAPRGAEEISPAAASCRPVPSTSPASSSSMTRLSTRPRAASPQGAPGGPLGRSRMTRLMTQNRGVRVRASLTAFALGRPDAKFLSANGRHCLPWRFRLRGDLPPSPAAGAAAFGRATAPLRLRRARFPCVRRWWPAAVPRSREAGAADAPAASARRAGFASAVTMKAERQRSRIFNALVQLIAREA